MSNELEIEPGRDVRYGGETTLRKWTINFSFNENNPLDIEMMNYMESLHKIGDLHRFVRDAVHQYYPRVVELGKSGEKKAL